MKKYFYENTRLRCRVEYIKYLNHFELQIQRRFLFVFWINIWKWMTVKDGFWGESNLRPILRMRYSNGNLSEAYLTGTLNVKHRVNDFFQEYFDYKNTAISMVGKLNEI